MSQMHNNRPRAWTPNHLWLIERRLRRIELIAFHVAAFAFGFGFITAWAFWG